MNVADEKPPGTAPILPLEVTVNNGGYQSPTPATIRTQFRRSSSSPLTHSLDTSRGGPSHFMPCASAIFASTGCLLERTKKSSILPAGVNPISIRPGLSPTYAQTWGTFRGASIESPG